MENHLIKYISNLSNYKRYSSLIRDEYLSDIPKFIYDNLKTYFNETEKQDVDWDEFKAMVLMNHPNLSDSKVKSFVGYVNKLAESDDEVENFVIKNLSSFIFQNALKFISLERKIFIVYAFTIS